MDLPYPLLRARFARHISSVYPTCSGRKNDFLRTPRNAHLQIRLKSDGSTKGAANLPYFDKTEDYRPVSFGPSELTATSDIHQDAQHLPGEKAGLSAESKEKTVKKLSKSDILYYKLGQWAANEEAIEELEQRDVSGLNGWHHAQLSKRLPPIDHYPWQRADRGEMRRRFAAFGFLSGVNPGLLWPTKEEMVETIAFDRQRNPGFHQSLEEHTRTRREDTEQRQKWADEFEANLKAYPSLLEDHKKKEHAKEQETLEEDQRIAKMATEISEFVGYAMHEKDPRFQEMMDRKAEEKKKAEKEAKKLAKKQKAVELLEQKMREIQQKSGFEVPQTTESKDKPEEKSAETTEN